MKWSGMERRLCIANKDNLDVIVKGDTLNVLFKFCFVLFCFVIVVFGDRVSCNPGRL